MVFIQFFLPIVFWWNKKTGSVLFFLPLISAHVNLHRIIDNRIQHKQAGAKSDPIQPIRPPKKVRYKSRPLQTSQPHLNLAQLKRLSASRIACRATKHQVGGSGRWAREPPASGRMRSPDQWMCLSREITPLNHKQTVRLLLCTQGKSLRFVQVVAMALYGMILK
jgi:hypothetical protein